MSPVKHYLRAIEPYAFRHAFATFCIIITALIIVSQSQYTQPSWLIFASLIFSQLSVKNVGDRKDISLRRYIVIGLCSIIAVLLANVTSNYFIPTVIVLVLITAAASFIGRKFSHYYYSALIVNFFGIAAAFFPANGTEEVIERCAFILIAIFLAYVVKAIFYLYQNSKKTYDVRRIYFQKLQAIFYCIFVLDAQDEHYEKKFQNAWTEYLAALSELRCYSTVKQIIELEKLGDITFSLGSLRYRINDPSVLKMGKREFQAIWNAIVDILDQLTQSRSAPDVAQLTIATQGLETLYESMLQTVTKDPLVLLLFIQDLYALEKLLSEVTIFEIPALRSLDPTSMQRDKPRVWVPVMRCVTAVLLALVSTYYLSMSHTFWLCFAALLITQTEIALPLHQMILRALQVILVSILFSFIPAGYTMLAILILYPLLAYSFAFKRRIHAVLNLFLMMLLIAFVATMPIAFINMYYLLDIIMGAAIGIACNLLIFPDKAAQEFSKRVVPIIKSNAEYFTALLSVLVQRDVDAERLQLSKRAVENYWAKRDILFPIWVFEPGFNPLLKPGQYYFAVHLGQVTEILFALQHFVRHSFEAELLAKFVPALQESMQYTQKLFDHLTILLEGKKPGVIEHDTMADILILEEGFRQNVGVSLELLDISRDYVYLAAIIRYLKDLRSQLLQLIATLNQA
ncbi:MAG TPA: hypothetical protein VHA13_00695 [Gammaproteobacteria bacterium]|nr:hypothetical protein [Gammaproteobacteria bacterium]